ncbi:MAG TPA: protein kinase [Candidatus Kapabacteria bacterium]|nr:protein kinase [Candidatus Kapabacteria bacterium]
MSEIDPGNGGAPRSRRVGSYEILDEIGAGGMSRVFRGRHTLTGEIVAIKVMPIDNMAPDYEARLRREPEIQQGIGHENIVRLVESFRDGDQFFLVMEFVDGRSLAKMIHRETGPLPFIRARHYVRQILRGLDHLHRLGIVHRDIKPSNILIGANDTVKLADFGIAKYAWQEAQTSTQRGLGTPEYMSPEQARGRHVDHRSDIYSLGITLFEALTGRRPYARDEQTPAAYGEVMQEILNRPLPDPRAYNPAITPDVVRLLNKATAKDPADRFQSCSEFLGALEIAADDLGIAAPVPPSFPSTIQTAIPEPSAPTVVGVGAARAAGQSGQRLEMSPPTMAQAPPGQEPARQEPARPEPVRPAAPVREPAPRRIVWPWVLLLLVALSVGGYYGWRWYRSTQMPHVALTDADAMRISRNVASDVKKYTIDGNAPALASLYDSTGVDFFKDHNVSRKAVQDDLSKFVSRIVRSDQYDIEIRRARAVNDSTVETEWVITYQRMRNDSTLLRGSTSNILKLVRASDGQWLIGGQREVWTKRDNVTPSRPVADSASADSLHVYDLQRTKPADRETQISTFRMFLSMTTSGDASQAWDTYVGGKLHESPDRTRFATEFASQGWELQDVTVEGDAVVAHLTRSELNGPNKTATITGSVADVGGQPKVMGLRTSVR